MKDKKCKVCKTMYTPQRPLQSLCSPKCAYTQIEARKRIEWKQRKETIKKELLSRSDHLKIAQTAFNSYIRKRDEGKKCISCGKTLRVGNVDAGHLWSAGGHSNVRFNEKNVNAQCSRPCNKDLSGDVNNYRIGFIERYSKEDLEELDAIAKIPKKWDIEELKKLTILYKKKIKQGH